MERLSIGISALAFATSLVTLWLTRYRTGTIKMTRPTTIFFGPDGGGSTISKVFIRTLLYTTADRGQYIENMFVRLYKKREEKNFTIWIYGDPSQLLRGSGLFVDRRGVAANHHFLISDASHTFSQGSYTIELYVTTVGASPKRIFRQKLEITHKQAQVMRQRKAGIYYDWVPHLRMYETRIDKSEINSYRPS